MKKTILLIALIIFVLAVYGLMLKTYTPQLKNIISGPADQKAEGPSLVINAKKISLEIADTPEKRTQGLSGRESLSDDSGMLFIFDSAGIYSFWMKDMNFPLDFIWIKDKKVVDLNENIPPPSQTGGNPQVVNPKENADMVLEVNAGFIKENGIKVGDGVEVVR